MPARPAARTAGRNRSGTIPAEEWAVFTRETPTDPMVHTGTVRAADEAEARERAVSLFPDVDARWICPTDALGRDVSASLDGGESS